MSLERQQQEYSMGLGKWCLTLKSNEIFFGMHPHFIMHSTSDIHHRVASYE